MSQTLPFVVQKKKKKLKKKQITEEFLKQNGEHLKGLHIRHKVPGGDRNTLN